MLGIGEFKLPYNANVCFFSQTHTVLRRSRKLGSGEVFPRQVGLSTETKRWACRGRSGDRLCTGHGRRRQDPSTACPGFTALICASRQIPLHLEGRTRSTQPRQCLLHSCHELRRRQQDCTVPTLFGARPMDELGDRATAKSPKPREPRGITLEVKCHGSSPDSRLYLICLLRQTRSVPEYDYTVAVSIAKYCEHHESYVFQCYDYSNSLAAFRDFCQIRPF